MSTRARGWIGVCALTVVFTCASIARADDPGSSEALFNRANELLAKGDVAGACTAFAASHKAEAKLGTLLNLASCHSKQGKLATALVEFRQVERQSADAGQNERSGVAKALADEFEARVPRLVVRVGEPLTGMTVERDGVVLDAQALGVEVRVDLGTYKIRAQAPGRETWTQEVAVQREGGVTEVIVPALKKPSPPRTGNEEGKGSGLTIAGWSLFAGGGAVAIVGGVLGVLTLVDVAAAEDDPLLCPGKKCSDDGLDAIEAAEAKGIASTVLLGVGVVAAGIGLTLVLLPKTDRAKEDAVALLRVQVMPRPGGAAAALALDF